MIDKEKTLTFLTDCCKECFGIDEPRYFGIKDNTIFFINGCPSIFADGFDGTWVNTTSIKGGFSIHNPKKGFSFLEFKGSMDSVLFNKDKNIISICVDGVENFKKIKVDKDVFDEVYEMFPSLIEHAKYYNLEKVEENNNVRFVLKKK